MSFVDCHADYKQERPLEYFRAYDLERKEYNVKANILDQMGYYDTKT